MKRTRCHTCHDSIAATLAETDCVASRYRPLTGPPCIVQISTRSLNLSSWELAQMVETEMDVNTLGV